nr:SMC-Scp complex subunit ScpB [Desulfurispira natronophila]
MSNAANAGDEAHSNNTPSLESLVEAVLFAAEEPIAPARISRILDVSGVGEGTVQAIIEQLKSRYHGGVRIIEADGAYYMGTTQETGKVVSRTLLGSKRSRTSRAVLETLAVIAYNQPATKSEVEAVRGVDSSSAVKRLLDRNLITVVGRKESAGKPFLYSTTRLFLQTFGISNLAELPVPGESHELEEDWQEDESGKHIE